MIQIDPERLAHLKLVERLAKAFCKAEIEYPILHREFKKKYGNGLERGWTRERFAQYKKAKMDFIKPCGEKRARSLSRLKKLLCGWEPGKPGPAV